MFSVDFLSLKLNKNDKNKVPFVSKRKHLGKFLGLKPVAQKNCFAFFSSNFTYFVFTPEKRNPTPKKHKTVTSRDAKDSLENYTFLSHSITIFRCIPDFTILSLFVFLTQYFDTIINSLLCTKKGKVENVKQKLILNDVLRWSFFSLNIFCIKTKYKMRRKTRMRILNKMFIKGT